MIPSTLRPMAAGESGIGNANVTGCENPARPATDHVAPRTKLPVCVPGPAPPALTSPSSVNFSSFAVSVRMSARWAPVSSTNARGREPFTLAWTMTCRPASSKGMVTGSATPRCPAAGRARPAPAVTSARTTAVRIDTSVMGSR